MITCRYRLSAVADMSLGFLCLFGKYLLWGYSIAAKNLLFEVGGNHIAKAQKYYDDMTNIVVVLERAGVYGARLVTTYRRGEENLISDEEYQLLHSRGLI
ncbi:hypothetical protein [Helicobacter cinaedi]|nr:hypothetical protein [Helicobacter cinaedi]